MIAGAFALALMTHAHAQTNPGTSPLSVPKGGSGVATFTSNCVPYGNGTSPLQCAAPAAGAVLNSNSSSTPVLTATPVLGVAGSTVGTIGFQNATSGTLTLKPQTGALGASILTLPAATDTLVGRGTTDTFSGVKSFNSGKLILNGATSGSTTLNASSTASGTLTLPAATDTLVGRGTSDTFTNKTFSTAGTGNVFQINGTTVNAVTGSGSTAVLSTSPTLVTPTLGVASATSVNKVVLTAPATGSTLTIADGKTLSANNSITFSGTDATTMTFPSINANVAALNIAGQTITGGANVTTLSQATGNLTVNCGLRPAQSIANGGAFTISAPANDGYCVLLVTNNSTAGAISFSGFSVGANTGDALTTTSGSRFMIFVYRVDGVSTFSIKALQ
jgi:hypothetical protein